MRFKEFIDKSEEKKLTVWFDPSDTEASEYALQIIEEGKTYSINSRYSARHDKGLQPNQLDHTHIYLKGKEVCVVNKDGTPSHGSPGFNTLPKNVQKIIKDYGLVESSQYLIENANTKPPLIIPPALMATLKSLILQDKLRSSMPPRIDQ